MANTANILEEIRERIDCLVDSWRDSFANNDLSGCHANEAMITEELREYKKQSLNSALYALKKESDPMRAAVKQLTYGTLRFKHDKADGVEVGAHIEPSTERLDIVQVAKYCGKPSDFQYDAEKLAQLCAARATEDLNEEDERKAAAVARVKAKYRISEKGRAVDEGTDPTSNTQLIARIQRFVDKVFPGGGLKVMKRDLSFILNGFTKISREVGTIDIGQSKLMIRLLVDMLNRKITGAAYLVAYKEVRDKAQTTEAKVETVIVEAPKDETEAPKVTVPKAKRKTA